MYIVKIVHETNKKVLKKTKTVTCFFWEVDLPSGTELIPLFPYLGTGL